LSKTVTDHTILRESGGHAPNKETHLSPKKKKTNKTDRRGTRKRREEREGLSTGWKDPEARGAPGPSVSLSKMLNDWRSWEGQGRRGGKARPGRREGRRCRKGVGSTESTPTIWNEM